MKIEHLLELIETKGDFGAATNIVKQYLEALATVEDDALHKRLLKELISRYVILEKQADQLLKNTLPPIVADEIKYEGRFKSRAYSCTILFTDFVGFTRLAESMSNNLLIETLDHIFSEFDLLIAEHQGTKIKTIGDAYMAVFGAPVSYEEHPMMAVRAAMALLDFLDKFNSKAKNQFNMRIGIHTGSVMAGVVGRERMQFDIFGDDVNIAARFESSGVINKANVSESTYAKTKSHFHFEERGLVNLKNKGQMKAYIVIDEKNSDMKLK
ncbi:MAG: adenylate/guanylate cyclase domain-containing protein [Desulfobacterales bacterium]|nr:adenylate/guanylate cyclase domain-containing protein [Desulfobacterales bacterium]